MKGKGTLALYLGGIRSGKSAIAMERVEAFAGPSGKVAYLATALPKLAPKDKALAKRLAEHRQARPAHWQTLEGWEDLLEPLKKASRSHFKALILDGMGMWAARQLQREESSVLDAVEVFAKSCRYQASLSVIVADEVGLGGVSANALARRFADLNGKINQALARHADEVWIVHAGLPLRLK